MRLARIKKGGQGRPPGTLFPARLDPVYCLAGQ